MTHSSAFDAKAIERPDPALMMYYFLASFRAGPFFLLALIPSYLKYRTLSYRFDDEGVSMKWGFLYRHEINLTYRRIQDIHLTRNIVERWMGLATVAVQTASGSSKPEMTIEGVLLASELRDFLYSQMRGARGMLEPSPAEIVSQTDPVELLREIRDLLRQLVSAKGQK